HPDLRALDEGHPASCGCRRGARAEAADLDPAREPDAQVTTLLAGILLLFAQLVVTGDLHSRVHRLLVSARVVDQPEVAGVGEIGDEVLAPDRRRVHLELRREQVDPPPAKARWLRPARPAAGAGRN